MATASLICPGKKTVTGLLTTQGRWANDWSADYRLFSRNRVDTKKLFDVVREEVIERIGETEPLVAALDDTLLPRRGRKMPGASWRRDPLGPKFSMNLVWAQRAAQISAAVPRDGWTCAARMIPIDFRSAPSPKKPGKKADDAKRKEYDRLKKEMSVTSLGARMIKDLRDSVDPARPVWITADNAYVNKTVLRDLPENVTLIGRVRKDCALHLPPSQTGGRGRKRLYGDAAPTPEQLRVDESAWEKVTAWAAGKTHEFRVKTMSGVLWRTAGPDKPLRVIVIAPLGYRLTKNSKVYYRDPSYLICTDPDAPLEKVLQAYIWRWGIECNFRDEKQIIGIGHAQVRDARSAETIPQMLTATYGMAQLAAMAERAAPLPRPRWRKSEPHHGVSTQEIINLMRAELWGASMGMSNFTGFADESPFAAKGEKWPKYPATSIFYAT